MCNPYCAVDLRVGAEVIQSLITNLKKVKI